MFYYLLANFLSIVNLTSIKILLPDIMIAFNTDINWLTWAINAYSLPLAVMLPICGRLGDNLGARKFFNSGLIVFGLGSLLCGIAPFFGFLLGARVVQALGAALIVPSSLILLLEKTPEERRGSILGTWGTVGSIGAILGPIISGVLTDAFSWRSTFFVLMVISLLIYFASITGFYHSSKEIKESKLDFDYLGGLFFVLSSILFLIGITLLPDLGFWTAVIFLTAAIALIKFYQIETIVSKPMINLMMLKNLGISFGLSIGFIEQIVLAGTLFVIPIYFNMVHDYNYTETALLLTPTAIAMALICPLGGYLSNRIGCYLPIMIGMLIRGISFILLSQISVNTSYIYIATSLAINGVGFGFTTVPALNLVLSTSAPDARGLMGGIHNMFRYIGAAVGTTISGMVLYAFIPVSIGRDYVAGIIPGFWEVFVVNAVICFMSVLVGLIFIVKYRILFKDEKNS